MIHELLTGHKLENIGLLLSNIYLSAAFAIRFSDSFVAGLLRNTFIIKPYKIKNNKIWRGIEYFRKCSITIAYAFVGNNYSRTIKEIDLGITRHCTLFHNPLLSEVKFIDRFQVMLYLSAFGFILIESL